MKWRYEWRARLPEAFEGEAAQHIEAIVHKGSQVVVQNKRLLAGMCVLYALMLVLQEHVYEGVHVRVSFCQDVDKREMRDTSSPATRTTDGRSEIS